MTNSRSSGTMLNVSVGGRALVRQGNTLELCPFGTSPLDIDTLRIFITGDRSQVNRLAFDTANLAFDIEKETNSTSLNRESISAIGCVEEDRACSVRSHPVLKANGSMVSSRTQLSDVRFELLRADVHCPIVEVLLVYMIVTLSSKMIEWETSVTPPPTS